MFGMRRKQPSADEQVPYEVYQTIHGPVARRRRLIVRLLAALIIVTIAFFGALAWTNRSKDDKPASKKPSTASQQPQSGVFGNNPIGQPSRQAPQNNAPIPKPETPQEAPAGTDKPNDGTVKRPQ